MDGPGATSPLGFTESLWVPTGLFQVSPPFFFVGGYVHLRAWQRARVRGEGLGRFVDQDPPALLPAVILAAVWVTLGLLLGGAFDIAWSGRCRW